MKLHTPLFEEGGDSGQGNGGGTLLSQAAGGGESSSSAAVSVAKTDGNEGGSTAWDFRSSLDDKGNFKPGWDQGLPDDLKPSAASLAKYPNPLELLRGTANAQKLIGQKATLTPPAPDAAPEVVAKYNESIRAALGVPAKVEDYKITPPAGLPEGVKVNEAELKDFTALAHSLNIPPAAAAKLMEFDVKRMAALQQNGQAMLDEFVKGQEAELKKDWGNDFEANLGKAAKAAQMFGFDLNDGELGNNAKFVKAMFTASNLIAPDRLVGSDKTGVVMDGKAQAEDIRRNANNPWHKAYLGEEGPARQQEAASLMARLQGVKL